MDRRKRIAIFGWYNHQNIGDEFFKRAFLELFPNYELTFLGKIDSNINTYDAVMIGGGSFLEKDIENVELIKVPLAFVGVGISSVSPKNLQAIKNAKIVVSRNEHQLASYCIPDLVYSLGLKKTKTRRNKITVMLNNHFCPNHNSKEYQLRSWDWFSIELSQYLDRKIDEGFENISFFPMCTNVHVDDRRASSYVIDRMKNKDKVSAFTSINYQELEDKLIDELSESSLVVSQRLHGLILSSILEVPFISISGHDKITDLCREAGYPIVPYYGFNIAKMKEMESVSYTNIYKNGAREKWKDMSAKIETALFG